MKENEQPQQTQGKLSAEGWCKTQPMFDITNLFKLMELYSEYTEQFNNPSPPLTDAEIEKICIEKVGKNIPLVSLQDFMSGFKASQSLTPKP